jgi:hypothetical protein
MQGNHSSLSIMAALLAAVLLTGCAGRSEMRAVASQSSAILNQTQTEAARYADAQTRYEASAQANIASFNKMTTIGNQEADSGTWIDSSMSGLYNGVRPRSLADYQKIIDDATAAPTAPNVITIDTSKVRAAVAQMNELAKEETLESRLAFLTMFAKAVASAYQDAQKKAADQANSASDSMKSVSPVQK